MLMLLRLALALALLRMVLCSLVTRVGCSSPARSLRRVILSPQGFLGYLFVTRSAPTNTNLPLPDANVFSVPHFGDVVISKTVIK